MRTRTDAEPTNGCPRRWRLKAIGAVAAALAVVAVIAGCGGSDSSASDDGKLQVATTVAPITSIVANIGGDRVTITGIVPEGTNSHTFEPKPSVAELLSTVDVVYVNGLKLEEPTEGPRRGQHEDGAELVELGTMSIPEERVRLRLLVPQVGGQAQPAPLDRPEYALSYAKIVQDDLSKRDPGNAEYYAANYDKFAAMIGEFDTAMRASFATIPAGNRKLLTYHDAYAYFGRDYGWEIIGAIQVCELRGPHAEGGREPDRPGPGPEGAGHLRVRGLPEPGVGANRQGDRGQVRGRAARRRPARRTRASRATRGSA